MDIRGGAPLGSGWLERVKRPLTHPLQALGLMVAVAVLTVAAGGLFGNEGWAFSFAWTQGRAEPRFAVRGSEGSAGRIRPAPPRVEAARTRDAGTRIAMPRPAALPPAAQLLTSNDDGGVMTQQAFRPGGPASGGWNGGAQPLASPAASPVAGAVPALAAAGRKSPALTRYSGASAVGSRSHGLARSVARSPTINLRRTFSRSGVPMLSAAGAGLGAIGPLAEPQVSGVEGAAPAYAVGPAGSATGGVTQAPGGSGGGAGGGGVDAGSGGSSEAAAPVDPLPGLRQALESERSALYEQVARPGLRELSGAVRAFRMPASSARGALKPWAEKLRGDRAFFRREVPVRWARRARPDDGITSGTD